jgi:hypothetical protein
MLILSRRDRWIWIPIDGITSSTIALSTTNTLSLCSHLQIPTWSHLSSPSSTSLLQSKYITQSTTLQPSFTILFPLRDRIHLCQLITPSLSMHLLIYPSNIQIILKFCTQKQIEPQGELSTKKSSSRCRMGQRLPSSLLMKGSLNL